MSNAGGDVDRHGRFVRVSRSCKNGRLEMTKTDEVRNVHMSDQFAETLKRLHTTRKEEGLKNGGGEVMETILHRNGGYMEQNYLRRLFKRLLSKAGLREIRVHDIRHIKASLLLSDGASHVHVREQLGHTGIRMTVISMGGHLTPNSNGKVIKGLDRQPSAIPPQPVQKQRT